MTDFSRDIAAVTAIEAVPTILEVICRTTGLGFAAIARVTDERWIACAVRDEIAFGLAPGGELEVGTTICAEVRDSGNFVVIDEVPQDARFRDHATPKLYGFQSYISVPIRRADGRMFGTLCAIDPKPARLNTPAIIGMFRMFADLIAFHLQAQEEIDTTQAALADARQTADFRETFIAILGHDLRNPLASIDAGARMLNSLPLDDRPAGIVRLILKSAARMSGLIDNVLDFARGRLGEGITIDRRAEEGLAAVLEHVISELRTVWPEHRIDSDIVLERPVSCDPARVAQLFSNLLANALTHGDAGLPVEVRARSDADGFTLSVANGGPAIPDGDLARLFQPFARAAAPSSREGLGLGLYISSEIARAHGGTLTARSSAAETRFTFRIPPIQA